MIQYISIFLENFDRNWDIKSLPAYRGLTISAHVQRKACVVVQWQKTRRSCRMRTKKRMRGRWSQVLVGTERLMLKHRQHWSLCSDSKFLVNSQWAAWCCYEVQTADMLSFRENQREDLCKRETRIGTWGTQRLNIHLLLVFWVNRNYRWSSLDIKHTYKHIMTYYWNQNWNLTQLNRNWDHVNSTMVGLKKTSVLFNNCDYFFKWYKANAIL